MGLHEINNHTAKWTISRDRRWCTLSKGLICRICKNLKKTLNDRANNLDNNWTNKLNRVSNKTYNWPIHQTAFNVFSYKGMNENQDSIDGAREIAQHLRT